MATSQRPRTGAGSRLRSAFFCAALGLVLQTIAYAGTQKYRIIGLDDKGIPGLTIIEHRGSDTWGPFTTDADGYFKDGYRRHNKTYRFTLETYKGLDHLTTREGVSFADFRFRYSSDHQPNDPYVFKVHRGPILGRVTYGSSGVGMAGLTITNSKFASIVATTDENGDYVLQNVGTVYLSQITDVGVVAPGPDYVFDPSGRANVVPGTVGNDFRLNSGPLTGRVTLGGVGLPQVNVEIRWVTSVGTQMISTTTDADGRFAEGLAALSYTIRPVLDGFSFDNYEHINVWVGTDLDIKVKSGPIRGRVRGRNGVGIGNVKIAALQNGTQYAVTTTSNALQTLGGFEFSNLPVGTYTLVPAADEGLTLLPVPAEVSANVVDIVAGYRIVGQVRSGVDRDFGVPNVEVSAWDDEAQVGVTNYTQNDGRYVISGLDPGVTYQVSARQAGLGVTNSPVSMMLNQPFTTNDFDVAALITGTITWAHTELKDVSVTATDAGQSWAARSRADGSYELRVPYGMRQVTVQGSLADYTFTPEARLVRPGPTATNVSFVASGGIFGVITNQKGTPVVGIQVTARTNGNPMLLPATTTTGANGMYRFGDLPQGEYIVAPEWVGFVFDPAARTNNTVDSSVDFKVVQSPPTISPINDQFVARNSSSPIIPFQVDDLEQAAGELIVSAESSNPDLVTPTGIALAGQGKDRTVQITPQPGQFGTATITLMVDDQHGGRTVTRFQMNVDVRPAYAIIDLGVIEGYDESYGVDVNDQGQVIGYVSSGTSKRGFMGQASGVSYTLQSILNETLEPTALNEAGAVVGIATNQAFLSFLDAQSRRFTNVHARLQGLGADPSQALDINGQGWILGRKGDTVSVITNLASTSVQLFANRNQWAVSVSDGGMILGYSDTNRGVLLWTNIAVSLNATRMGTNHWLKPQALGGSGKIVGQSLQEVIGETGTVLLPDRAFLLDTNDASGAGLIEFTLPNGGVSVAYGINRRDEVVGQASNSGGQPRAFLYRGGRVHDLNDLVPAEQGWELTEARSINAEGMIVGSGVHNNQRRAFLAVPAVVAGTPVPVPEQAVANFNDPPSFKVELAEDPVYLKRTCFLWSLGDSKLFALAGGVTAEISWPTSTAPGSPRLKQIVRTVWPHQPPLHVVGAPVELQPAQVAGFPYQFFAVPFSTAGGENVDLATRTFNATRPGYSVIQYYVTGGGPLDPQRQPIFLQVCRSVSWTDEQFSTVKTPVPWAIGQSIVPVRTSAQGLPTTREGRALFEIRAHVPGAQLNGLKLDFRRDATLPGDARAEYREADRTLSLAVRPATASLAPIIAAVNNLSNCPYRALSIPSAPMDMPIGSVLGFDGTNDYVQVPHDPDLNALPLSLAFWINTQQAEGEAALLSKYDTHAKDGYRVYLRDGRVRTLYVSSNTKLEVNGPWIADGKWHHLALVWTRTKGELFVDGISTDSNRPIRPLNPLNNQADLLLGADPGPLACYAGQLDDLGVWNVALDATQVRGSMTNLPETAPTSLVSYWPMDDGSGTSLTNLLRNLIGTLQNEPQWFVTAPSVVSGGLLQHDDYPGRNGFVFFPNAFYDGAGPDRAYDRNTRSGPIIPVNRAETTVQERVGNQTNQMLVVWYHRDALGVSWPDLPVLYDPQWPTDAERIIISWQKNAPVQDAALYPNKRIYNQPDLKLPGFNPNEEHAAIFDEKVTALRDDLNVQPDRSNLGLSRPYVLMKYQDPFTEEWQMKVFAVTNQTPEHPFLYPQQVAQEIQPPFPLYLLNLCPETTTWSGPLWRDYKGKIYAYAAGPGLAHTNAVIRYYYPLQPGFYYDLNGDGQSEAAPGACIPWLSERPENLGRPVDVTYDIRWPDVVPALQLGSSLVTKRDGLPEIYGQARAEVLFEGVNPVYLQKGQRSAPPGYATNSGVRLYDPISERIVDAPHHVPLPAEVATQIEANSGRKLFPALPYHLRCRLLYDELDEKLIFRGFTIYRDQPADDPLLLPNVLTFAEKETIRTNLFNGAPAWQTQLEALYLLTRNPNNIDIDGRPGRDPEVYVGLVMTSSGLAPEPLGSGPKALTAALPLSAQAAQRLNLPGPNQALAALGTGTCWEASSLVGLDTGPAEHTLEAWVRLDDLPAGTGRASILTLGAESGSPHRWSIAWNGIASFGMGGANAVNAALPLSQWVHLAATYDGSTYRLYTNGVHAGSRSCSFDLQGLPFSLARSNASDTAAFRGAFTELRLWNEARQPEEIRRYLHLSLRGNEVGLVGYWRLDQNPGTNVVVDASGLGNAAQVMPGTAWINTEADLVLQANGYVTLAFNNDPTLAGLPVALKVIQLDASLGIYAGDLRVIASDNIFDERLTLRHSADFGFEPDRFQFEWYSHQGGDPYPIYNEYGELTNGWGAPRFFGSNLNYVTLGQGESAGVLVLSDNRWIMRYRPLPGNPLTNVLGTNWSDWAGAPNKIPKEAQLAEGWIKRVTQALNPFDARTDDFRNSEVNTFASLLVSAGRRYEGDVAFNPDADNVNKIGLIEAYQTVLNRGRNLSVDAEIENAPANEALLHAATKIADLYTMLGHEAYADAEDPTIGFTTPDGLVGSLAPSIFAFQNQMDSLLDEELALLRGRDQNLGRPAYNRLAWNFTHGDGQVAYQQVYNVFDTQTRDPVTGRIIPADGFIDVNDAAYLYPQGHGDAWGHYLTALQGYYRLLTHPNFNWQPRTEHILLAGVPVEVDYEDERKFATIAAAKAKTGAEIVNLTYRLHYVDDPAGQWQGYKDTETERSWGVDEWGRRAGQGAYFDWVVANAILPAQDPTPTHQGIQKVDRTTVPELSEIAAEHAAVQSRLDQSDVGLNPVGLAKGAVPFDIDPGLVTPVAGIPSKAHFDQIYERAAKAMNNAVTVFNHANDLTKNLRRTQDSAADFAKNVAAQERDYKNRLIQIFGYPYSGDIGPGKIYASGYDGPDLVYYNYVDETELTGRSPSGRTETVTAFFRAAENQISRIPDSTLPAGQIVPVAYPVSDSAWKFTVPAGSRGKRRAGGEIHTIISDVLQSQANYQQALAEYRNLLADIKGGLNVLQAKYSVGAEKVTILRAKYSEIETINNTMGHLERTEKACRWFDNAIWKLGETVIESWPVEGKDPVTFAMWTIKEKLLLATWGISQIFGIASAVAESEKNLQVLNKEEVVLSKDIQLQIADNRYEVQQLRAELEAKIREEVPKRIALFGLREKFLQDFGNYEAKVAEGLRLLAERDAFRQRVAGDVSEHRYSDMAFRIFRNDAIQKYRAQFDVAAKYVYLAATAYDYETTMLGNQTGAGRRFLTDIVKQRALGEWINGQPVIGRHGLADSLGRLQANWGVLKTQLGINNPEHEDGFFSLRSQLMRQRPEGYTNATFNLGLLGGETWKQALQRYRVEDLWEIPEFRRYCRPFAPESAGPQRGLVIPFSTTINFGLNFFGWPLSARDSAYDSSRFATKIRSCGILFDQYPTTLSSTPRVYLVPVGTDILRSAAADTIASREFKIVDQKIPVPFPIGYSDVNDPAYLPAQDSLSGSFIEVRRYSSFHAYTAGALAFDPGNDALVESRLVGRSVWNTRWLLIIPGGTFLADDEEGLNEFADNITDIILYFRTYSYSGN